MSCLLHTNQTQTTAAVNTIQETVLDAPDSDELNQLYQNQNKFVCRRSYDVFRKIMGDGDKSNISLYLIDTERHLPNLFGDFFQKLTDPAFAQAVLKEDIYDYAFYLANEKNRTFIKDWLKNTPPPQSENQLLFAQRLLAFFEEPTDFLELCQKIYPSIHQVAYQERALANLNNYLEKMTVTSEIRRHGWQFIAEEAAKLLPDQEGNTYGECLSETCQANLITLDLPVETAPEEKVIIQNPLEKDFDFLVAPMLPAERTKIIAENWERLKKIAQLGDLAEMPPAYEAALRDFMTEHWDKLISQKPPYCTYLQSYFNGQYHSEYSTAYHKTKELSPAQFNPLVKTLFKILPVKQLAATNEEFRRELYNFGCSQKNKNTTALFLQDIGDDSPLPEENRQKKYYNIGYYGSLGHRDLADFLPLMSNQQRQEIERGIKEHISDSIAILKEDHSWYEGDRVRLHDKDRTIQFPNSEQIANLIFYGMRPEMAGLGQELFRSLYKMKSGSLSIVIHNFPPEQKESLCRDFRQHYFSLSINERSDIGDDENLLIAAVNCDNPQIPLADEEEKQIKKYITTHIRRGGYTESGERQRNYRTRELLQYLLVKKGFSETETFLLRLKKYLQNNNEATLIRTYVENILRGHNLPNSQLINYASPYYS